MYVVYPGAPPAPVRLPGQKIFEEKLGVRLVYKGVVMGESRITTRAFYKKNIIFPDFGDAMSLRILSTFDSRAFQRI